jgi:hypothetical protein
MNAESSLDDAFDADVVAVLALFLELPQPASMATARMPARPRLLGCIFGLLLDVWLGLEVLIAPPRARRQ